MDTDMFYDLGDRQLDGLSPSTEEDDGLMLASAHPKKRAGRKKFKETRHPIYRGIRLRNSGKWVCEVREPNKKTRIWLGTYPTPEMAARAHDVAAIALRGRHGATLNFADSAWCLPTPASSETKDIQKAAAQAAELFRQPAGPSTPPATEVVPDSGYVHVQESSSLKSENMFEFDMNDEEMFGMPGLLNDMYHGMGMMPPPITSWHNNGGYDNDDMEYETGEVSLWSYSI